MTHYELTVNGTVDGKKRKGDFVCFINKRKIPALRQVSYILLKNSVNGKELKLSARVFNNPDLDADTIQIDQKIRCALVVDKGETVIFRPCKAPKESLFIKVLSQIFGVQKNLVRVTKDSYNDMEVNLCRLKRETMETIDVKDGDIIVIASEDGEKKIRQRVFAISETLENEVSGRTQGNSPYVDCHRLLDLKTFEKNSFDIQPLFIDFDSRKLLGVDECEPVRVYRDVPDKIKNRLHLISTPLILTVCTAMITLNTETQTNLIILSAGIVVILILNLLSVILKT